MSEPTAKTFDCVQSMRQTRDRISAEIERMDYRKLVEWLRGHHYEDPLLRGLATKAGQADAQEQPARQSRPD
ncbi:MAG: hypothetical protein FJ265_06270 [Planctomycetes bacterium]|nr:hypothetical protein [Planctomycetota bacterium]